MAGLIAFVQAEPKQGRGKWSDLASLKFLLLEIFGNVD